MVQISCIDPETSTPALICMGSCSNKSSLFYFLALNKLRQACMNMYGFPPAATLFVHDCVRGDGTFALRALPRGALHFECYWHYLVKEAPQFHGALPPTMTKDERDLCWVQWRVVLECASVDHFAFLLVAWVSKYSHLKVLLRLLCAGSRANLCPRAYSFVAHVVDSHSTSAVVEGLFRGFRIFLGGHKLVSNTAVAFAALEYLLCNQDNHKALLQQVRANAARSASAAAGAPALRTPSSFSGPAATSPSIPAQTPSMLVTTRSFSRGGGGEAAWKAASERTLGHSSGASEQQPDATAAFLQCLEDSKGCFDSLVRAAWTSGRLLSRENFSLKTVVELVEEGFTYSAAPTRVTRSERITRLSSRPAQGPLAPSSSPPFTPSAHPFASGAVVGAGGGSPAGSPPAASSASTPALTLRELLRVTVQPAPPSRTPQAPMHAPAAVALASAPLAAPGAGTPSTAVLVLGPWGSPSSAPFFVKGKLGNKEKFLLRTSLRSGGSETLLPKKNLHKILEMSALEAVRKKVPSGHVWGQRALFSSAKAVGRKSKGSFFTRDYKLRAATRLAREKE